MRRRLALLLPLLCAACALPARNVPLHALVRMGETVSLGGVAITPIEVLEDSRCPQDTQCVHQGRFRVRVRIAAGEVQEHILELGVDEDLGPVSLILTEASPSPSAGEVTPPHAYRLEFMQGSGCGLSHCGP
jgi:hypothetical protein